MKRVDLILQPGKKSLLLKEIMADNAALTPASVGSSSKREIGQSVKRKHLSMAQQSRMDKERENAILLYRQQKQRKLNASWHEMCFVLSLLSHLGNLINYMYCYWYMYLGFFVCVMKHIIHSAFSSFLKLQSQSYPIQYMYEVSVRKGVISRSLT